MQLLGVLMTGRGVSLESSMTWECFEIVKSIKMFNNAKCSADQVNLITRWVYLMIGWAIIELSLILYLTLGGFTWSSCQAEATASSCPRITLIRWLFTFLLLWLFSCAFVVTVKLSRQCHHWTASPPAQPSTLIFTDIRKWKCFQA